MPADAMVRKPRSPAVPRKKPRVHTWVRILDIIRLGKHFDLRVEWEGGQISDHSMYRFCEDSPIGVRNFLEGHVPENSVEVAQDAMRDPIIRRLLQL
jgi:hypothetical protein